jgi:hypothetical protein
MDRCCGVGNRRRSRLHAQWASACSVRFARLDSAVCERCGPRRSASGNRLLSRLDELQHLNALTMWPGEFNVCLSCVARRPAKPRYCVSCINVSLQMLQRAGTSQAPAVDQSFFVSGSAATMRPALIAARKPFQSVSVWSA